jgi:hypothetical protein
MVPAQPTPPPPTIMLRRLACPHLPPNDQTQIQVGTPPVPRPNPDYNPYITVDYMEDVHLNSQATPVAQRFSVGRPQPYAGHKSLTKSQQVNPPLQGQPQHTFFRHNGYDTAPAPNPAVAPTNYPAFDWLVHLDRQLISPMELLHVSAFKPHELTQRFSFVVATSTAAVSGPGLMPVTLNALSGTTTDGEPWSIQAGSVLRVDSGNSEETVVVTGVTATPPTFTANFTKPHNVGFIITLPQKHRAPWFDQSKRLYRFFEFVDTHDRDAGMRESISHTTIRDTQDLGPSPTNPAKHRYRYRVTATRGVHPSGTSWQIVPGTPLILERGQAQLTSTGVVRWEEHVIVTSVPDDYSFEAEAYVPHNPGVNPGGTAYYPSVSLLTAGDRIPGRINLNTVWDPETLLALGDPQLGNNFTVDDLYRPFTGVPNPDNPTNPQTIFWRMMKTRTPGLLTAGGRPGPSDRPFGSMATGYSPKQNLPAPAPIDWQHLNRGSGINDTLLRAFDPNADALPGGGADLLRLFEVPNVTHPYQKYELLTKIFSNVTVRSNVFAVWVTVGFFAVENDSTRPVKLGAEIGRAENRHVRHRMFAIVDRSGLEQSRTTTETLAVHTMQSPVDQPGVATVLLEPGAAGALDIYPGTRIIVWTETQDALGVWQQSARETITVSAVDPPFNPTSFTATFNFAHPIDPTGPPPTRFRYQVQSPILASPAFSAGPQLQFNPRLTAGVVHGPDVVPYFSIID